MDSYDIHILTRRPGNRENYLQTEQPVANTIKYFAVQHIPVAKTNVLDVMEIDIAGVSPSERLRVSFNVKLGRPSYKWLQNFLSRHNDMKVRPMQFVEMTHIQGGLQSIAGEHISRIRAAVTRY